MISYVINDMISPLKLLYYNIFNIFSIISVNIRYFLVDSQFYLVFILILYFNFCVSQKVGVAGTGKG